MIVSVFSANLVGGMKLERRVQVRLKAKGIKIQA
jgi:hypothetical protein